jgi:hypothetical protein
VCCTRQHVAHCTHIHTHARRCLVSGAESKGRYAVTRNKRHVARQIAAFATEPTPHVPDNGRFVIEIDVQTFELRCARARVQALESDIAQNEDVTAFAGGAARTLLWRAAPDSEQMRERALCGTPLLLRAWQSDQRTGPPNQTHDREYDPSEVAETEKWIVDIFEPVRLAKFRPPACREELTWSLPEQDYDADAAVAHLIAKHPQKGGTW